MAIETTKVKRLQDQVKADLERHEGFREFAYPDVLSPLYKKYPREQWGFRPATDILQKIGVSYEDASRLGKPWTVGFGFTHGITPMHRMERNVAERQLEIKIADMDFALGRTYLPTFYDCATFVTKTVLINMAFNMGVAGLLSFRNSLRYIKEQKWSEAASNLRKSLWYRQVGSRARELVKRIETQTIAPEHKVSGE